ncbi:hormogonium polysaccharide secretion pseudopilin HpsC [Nostoc sp. NIES-2111]
MRALKFLLQSQLKRSKVIEPVGGFSLIELLAAMILAVLVITPLMGFMISIMNTDRQEQAKVNSEQEIQAALDYITRDLQQAIYIYDSAGIDAIRNELPNPTSTDRVPVLVFWKRELINQVITVGSGQDDTYVYSLVAYYLIKDSDNTWSNAARIARWQIRDGVPTTASGGVSCPGYTGRYVRKDSKDYCPSDGFAVFSLDGTGTIHEKMSAWKRLSQYTTKNASGADVVNTVTPAASVVLVDFIDQTITGSPAKATCPTGSNLVAPNTANFNTRDTFNMTSFYACVDRVNTTAQVFIRGNAIARLQNNNISYTASRSAYFPTASIRVQGRGYLFTQ